MLREQCVQVYFDLVETWRIDQWTRKSSLVTMISTWCHLHIHYWHTSSFLSLSEVYHACSKHDMKRQPKHRTLNIGMKKKKSCHAVAASTASAMIMTVATTTTLTVTAAAVSSTSSVVCTASLQKKLCNISLLTSWHSWVWQRLGQWCGERWVVRRQRYETDWGSWLTGSFGECIYVARMWWWPIVLREEFSKQWGFCTQLFTYTCTSSVRVAQTWLQSFMQGLVRARF